MVIVRIVRVDLENHYSLDHKIKMLVAFVHDSCRQQEIVYGGTSCTKVVIRYGTDQAQTKGSVALPRESYSLRKHILVPFPLIIRLFFWRHY